LTLASGEKNWCIEINTTDMPRRKLMVKVCPKNAAEARPVNIVATVDEYFFKIVSAYLKKNEDRMPCAALLHMRNIVALECPLRILKLSGPWNKAVPRMPRKLNIAPYPYRNKFWR